MDSLRELWYSHRGKIVGGILGFVVAIVIIAFGFFKALFITLYHNRMLYWKIHG